MSWKFGLSRYLPCLRFFACPTSPSSRGVMQWYCRNYEELKLLNPNFSLMIRTHDNAMPAVTAELDWTIDDLLRFMIQTGRFRELNGDISQERVQAAKEYLAIDWDQMMIDRFKSPGFDPEFPDFDERHPIKINDHPHIQEALQPYFATKNKIESLLATVKSGPNQEYLRSENALLMTRRVDLWCSGYDEVERAVYHLYKLARMLNNDRYVELPTYIAEYAPGRDDFDS